MFLEDEQPLMGIIKYSDGTFKKNDLIGFTPNSKYEFIIDGERLYRVLNKFITIKYEYQGNEEEAMLEGKPIEEEKKNTIKGFAEGRSK